MSDAPPLALPRRANASMTTAADPLRHYYLPLIRSFYRRRLADAVRLLPGRVGSLLDHGTGSGVFLPELSRWCDHLHACDVHDNLDLVRRMLDDEGIAADVRRARSTALPFDDRSFDAVVSMSVLEHVESPEECADEILRVLRPGGFAIVGLPIDGPLANLLLWLGYLFLPGARLAEEHVGEDRSVTAALDARFAPEQTLRIPRRGPRAVRLYRTTRYRRRTETR